MSTYGDNGEMLAELRRLLDAWGGDSTRWPDEARRRMEHLMRHVPQAPTLLEEARALDRALDMQVQQSVSIAPGLVDRIVMTAAGLDRDQPQSVIPEPETVGGRVITLRRNRTEALPSDRSREADTMPSRARWQAAALMAASLLAGIYLGGSVNLAPALQDFAVTLGVATGMESSELALGEDVADGEAL
jgi:hypothetical protein